MSAAICERAVLQTLSKLPLPMERLRLLAAVSGGADSMAMLCALRQQSIEKGFSLFAIHVQHGLRGENSREDEQFVREWCARLDVPLTVQNACLQGDMHSPGIEERARSERYRLFEEEALRLECHAVVCAHHGDDQAETILMHLCRGAGGDGLSGMREITRIGRMTVLRPFLSLSKRDLEEELLARGVPHREDESNQELCGNRNRLRLRVIPLLREIFPSAEKSIARAAENLCVDCDCLEQLADEYYQKAYFEAAHGVPALCLEPLRNVHEALLRRCVRRFFEACSGMAGMPIENRKLDHAGTMLLREAIRKGQTVNLPCGLKAVFSKDTLYCSTQSGEPLLSPAEAISLPPSLKSFSYQGFIFFRIPAGAVPRSSQDIVLSPEWLSRPLVLRTAMPGDCVRPLGSAGSKPLRRFFTDRKLPEPLRMALPLLCFENRVLWVPGVCTGEELRQTELIPGSVAIHAAIEQPTGYRE